jgi:hypothetical protein
MFPYCPPATIKSLAYIVPFSTITVATTPRPLSNLDSIIVPNGSLFKFAFKSKISDSKKIASNNLSIFLLFKADP